MSEHSNGGGSSRNCVVSHVPLWMCTEVKMVPTLGDCVERMRMSTLSLITCYKDRGLLLTMVS